MESDKFIFCSALAPISFYFKFLAPEFNSNYNLGNSGTGVGAQALNRDPAQLGELNDRHNQAWDINLI